MDELLTAAEIARVFRVHPSTVKAWARSERIHGYKTGREWMFLLEEVLDDLRNTKKPKK